MSAKSILQVVLTFVVATFLGACSRDVEDSPNFLILIADDMGVETLPCYPVGTKTATTPNLDNLCDNGLRFENFWAQAVCSPTRATMLTGQFGFRNGVGTPATGPTLTLPVPERPAGTPGETDDSGEATNGRGMGGGMGMGRRNAVPAGRLWIADCAGRGRVARLSVGCIR
jgi:hypothetical protein